MMSEMKVSSARFGTKQIINSTSPTAHYSLPPSFILVVDSSISSNKIKQNVDKGKDNLLEKNLRMLPNLEGRLKNTA